MKKFLALLLTITTPAFGYITIWEDECSCDPKPCFWDPCAWSGDISLTTGYRNDRIGTTIQSFLLPNTFIAQDKLKGRGINIFELGLKGKVYYCNEAFIRGHATFGWVCDGKYHEKVTAPIIFSSTTHAKIHNGHTRDYSLGIGYLFSYRDCFKIGPAVGYSYDFQKIKLGKATTDGEPDPTLDHLSYDMRWQGPWVGAEAEFWIQCIQVNVGYEYHWGRWRANWTLAGPDVFQGSFSDKRRSHDTSGNVVFIEGNYTFCGCWNVGLGFKYQSWEVYCGHEVPRAGSFPAIGLPANESDVVTKATWNSAQIQLSLGYLF